MAEQNTPNTTITFDRIGRNHNVDPLVITDTDDWDEIADRVYHYARPHLRSQDVEVVIQEDPNGVIAGMIVCGLRNGGTFKGRGGVAMTYRHAPESDEDRPNTEEQ